MHKYEIIIYRDNRDNIYIADVPELSGCSAHSKTYNEALGNVNEAIELWINTAKEFGDPISEPKGSRLMYA